MDTKRRCRHNIAPSVYIYSNQLESRLKNDNEIGNFVIVVFPLCFFK